MIAVLAVTLGAMIGAPARSLIEQYIGRRYASAGFPLALSIVNITGSLLAGFVVAVTTGDLQLFLVMGLAGAFTTFSGWALAISTGFRIRRTTLSLAPALAWVVGVGLGVLVICVAAAYIGTVLGDLIAG